MSPPFSDEESQTPSHNLHPQQPLSFRPSMSQMPNNPSLMRASVANQQQQRSGRPAVNPLSIPQPQNTTSSMRSSPPNNHQQQTNSVYSLPIPPTQNNSSSTQSSSPNQSLRPYPQYPLSISPDKLPRAIELFGKLRLARGLAQRERDRAHLEVPNRAGPPSVVSHTSSGHTPVSPSTYGAGRTESVLSFDAESPSSAVANASNEFTTFTGQKVKTRRRDKLSPEAKAKAALIRHLGSCWVCRARRVPCPLDHHDVEALENGLREREARRHSQPRPQPTQDLQRPYRQRAATSPQPSFASAVTVSDGIGRSQSQRNPQTTTSFNQDESLIGLGQQPNLLYTDFSAPGSAHSPIFTDNLMDPLASIDAQSQYTSYQNGQMFRIGVLRQTLFLCQHLVVGGHCQQRFSTPDELQTHFETAHFAFTRIDPAHRFHCFDCGNMCTFPDDPCLGCGFHGVKELWIYGSFIRIPVYERYQPDGQDFSRLDDPFFDSTYSAGGLSPNVGFGLGNNGGFDMNFGGFDQGFYPNNNTYHAPGPGSQGSNFEANNAPQQGNFQFQGNQFGKAADMNSMATRKWFAKTLQICQRHKLILIAIALLLTAILTVKTHDWFIAKGTAIYFHPNLPMIGFVGLIASFAMCHTYWWVKHPPFQLCIKSKGRRSQCLMGDLSTSVVTFGPAPPRAVSYIRGISL